MIIEKIQCLILNDLNREVQFEPERLCDNPSLGCRLE
uniref:Uncharacterized protein n=1 Tax=Anguilla anguilla TaxID=7936 RepID=A0A0E9QYA5_ANGAN